MSNAEKQQEYQDMLNKFRMKLITPKEWQAYCQKILFQHLEENKDVFIRLKDR